MQARILVGVPAYSGARHIAETLQCISEQDFAAFQVLISVDNCDNETARACEPFLTDPRFRMVVQDTQLGWDRNINWLMSECACEFFCYWQQDDLATTDYLRSLALFADSNPDFVCAFSDIQWFGDDRTRTSCPSLVGFALTRALYFLETMNGVPFRGLIRKSAIDRTGPIRHTEFQSAHEEFVWLAKLAREGPLGRVSGPLYYKRKHREAVSAKWDSRGPEWWRDAWIEFGIGVLQALLPLIAATECDTALTVVLERLCVPKDGRRLSYDPRPECATFAAEFLTTARTRCQLPAGDDARIIRAIVGQLHADAQELEARLLPMMRELDRTGELQLEFQANGTGDALLESGWSTPEDWGTWSDGRISRLRLPLAADGRRWRLGLRVLACAGPDRAQRVRLMIEDDELARWTFDSADPCDKELLLAPKAKYQVLTFVLPDAMPPPQRGDHNDPRALALGLLKATISEAST
jgi:GT2 family glycosyltransferase